MYLWIIAAFMAYFIKGLCGFANTLVFTSILSFGAANANISPVELLIGYPTNFILTWKNRKSLDYKVYLPLAALVLAGCIPGALLLKNADVSNIKVIFGNVAVLFGLEMFFRDKKRVEGNPLSQSSPRFRLTFGAVGLLAGVLCGLFGVGALLAVYVDRVTDSGSPKKCAYADSYCHSGIVCGNEKQFPAEGKDGTEDDGSIIDSVRCLTDTAEYVAVCACLKNGRILIQNGRKNVLQKYKMHYNDIREDEIQGTQRCCIFHPPYLSEFWMRFADTE